MEQELIIDQSYIVTHEHKGIFTIIVEKFDKDFTTGTITCGEATAKHESNIRKVGDKITLINTQCEFTINID